MMKKELLTLLLMVASLHQAMAWGQKGHDVTAYIAEQHLTPATRAAVDSIFSGRSLVYWANWLDNASHTQPYAYTKTWHYINVDEGQSYDTAPRNPAGDLVTGMRYAIAVLTDPTSSATDSDIALRILVHLTGDLHQPLHTGHASDLGGNNIKVKYFGSERNLHSIWDTSLVDSAHKWSYTEWQQQLDRLSPESQEAIIAGNIEDWTRQSMAISNKVYAAMPKGANIWYNEVATWSPVIEDQLLAAGLRLAHLLNLIYDPTYSTVNVSSM